MRKSIRTAVAAAADSIVRDSLPFLLAANGIRLDDMAADGASALKCCEAHRPDLLVADCMLPAMDGCALAEKALSMSGLPVKPAVLVLARREFPIRNRAKLESMGASFLCWPADRKRFCSAVNALWTEDQPYPLTMSNQADALLDALGFEDRSGRNALKCAAILCAQDERLLYGRADALYPMVGKMLSITAEAVERSIRYAIGAAWRSDKFENQHRIFADTVDAGRGQPTCGEMIARLADILRLEG